MSFDPNSAIIDSEYLFRAFHLDDWNNLCNRPSSALFKSSSSLSVDRDGERSDDEVIFFFRSRTSYGLCGIVKHTAAFYRSCSTEPTPDPLKDNIYHALINQLQGLGTNGSQAKKLSKSASLVIFAEG